MSVQPEIAAAREDVQRARDHIADTIAELEDRITAPVQAVKRRLDVGQMVREHPWAALAVAVSAGALVGGSGADRRAAAVAADTARAGRRRRPARRQAGRRIGARGHPGGTVAVAHGGDGRRGLAGGEARPEPRRRPAGAALGRRARAPRFATARPWARGRAARSSPGDGPRVFFRRADTCSACASTRSTLPLASFARSASLQPRRASSANSVGIRRHVLEPRPRSR